MARFAMAQEKIYALRREIARIEGRQPERFAAPTENGGETVLRHDGRAEGLHVPTFTETGTPHFDAALGGGLQQAALTEIVGRESRDGGIVSGFALALAAMASRNGRDEEQRPRPVLWVGMADMLLETGFPYAPGVEQFFDLAPDRLLMTCARRLEDALWVAEEAAQSGGLSAVFLEIRGNPARLDLTATRRLHHRAREAGRPVFLIRHSAEPEPTAAPTRLVISPAPSSPRETLAGALSRSIGPPAFSVALARSRIGRNENFLLEWNPHDFTFRERVSIRDRPVQENARTSGPQDPRGLVPASSVRSGSAAQAWGGLAPQRRKRRAG
ncbi:ImuA family protein [Chelativorans sp. YIM 93263]|uniref:ImuA family protein n=1 Tax=Chelativorans sp. YIM 93263 TaxID=2906648 RepID=UPI00237933CF|nr:hypothetical protein [Chelativorans sp. YIM 93263]